MSALSHLDFAETRGLPDPETWEVPDRLTRDELTAHGGVDLRTPWRSPDDMEDDQ